MQAYKGTNGGKSGDIDSVAIVVVIVVMVVVIVVVVAVAAMMVVVVAAALTIVVVGNNGSVNGGCGVKLVFEAVGCNNHFILQRIKCD